MSEVESPVVFECVGERLVGILHPGQAEKKTGVVIVVGGPQYRVGSHRQFVLMARRIAAAGYPVLRFDYRGMGDSEGDMRSFEDVDDDIRAAIDQIFESVPGLTKVVLLGLCDAASAILMYCTTDSRVSGLILLNPWARRPQGEARSYLHHYYLQRLLQKSFWRKVLSGKYQIGKSVGDFLRSLKTAHASTANVDQTDSETGGSFILRMEHGLEQFGGPVLFLISDRDLTAQEFLALARSSRSWRKHMKRAEVTTKTLVEADHTMSAINDLATACGEVTDWLCAQFPTQESLVSVRSPCTHRRGIG